VTDGNRYVVREIRSRHVYAVGDSALLATCSRADIRSHFAVFIVIEGAAHNAKDTRSAKQRTLDYQ
jgi:hypothetical protein